MAFEELAPDRAIGLRTAVVDGSNVLLGETTDFPVDDPWSRHTQEVISHLVEKDDQFAGKDIFEAGLGDGRNVIAAGFASEINTKLVGIELDEWRLAVARKNFEALGVDANRTDLYVGDAVGWLHEYDGPQLSGWGIACLPQAPSEATDNHADGIVDLPSIQDFKGREIAGHTIETYGLTLNAAFLDMLRNRVDPYDFKALVVLSDRVPHQVLTTLFAQTGWEQTAQHVTEEPIQQDPDTGVDWVRPFDDGKRFWSKGAFGVWTPLSAEEAEERRKASLSHPDPREALDVYHGLTVYELTPWVNFRGL